MVNNYLIGGGVTARQISTTFTDTEVNNCFSIYHTCTQKISLFLFIYRKMVENHTLDSRFCLKLFGG